MPDAPGLGVFRVLSAAKQDVETARRPNAARNSVDVPEVIARAGRFDGGALVTEADLKIDHYMRDLAHVGRVNNALATVALATPAFRDRIGDPNFMHGPPAGKLSPL